MFKFYVKCGISAHFELTIMDKFSIVLLQNDIGQVKPDCPFPKIFSPLNQWPQHEGAEQNTKLHKQHLPGPASTPALGKFSELVL